MKELLLHPKTFPSIIIVLFVVSGGISAYHGEYKKALYWFSAALLNIAVTY